MHLNKASLVVTLLLAVSNYGSLSVPHLCPRALPNEARFVFTNTHGQSVRYFGDGEGSGGGTPSFNQLSEYLGGNLGLRLLQDRRVDANQLKNRLLQDRKLISKEELISNIFSALQNREIYEKPIADFINTWEETFRKIHEHLSPVELATKLEIQEFVNKLRHNEFPKSFSPEYQTAIDSIKKNQRMKLKHDPSYYFKDLIFHIKQDNHMLDEFIRARAIQINTPKHNLEATSFSKPEDIVQNLPAQLGLKRVFLGYIMMEGFGKILREVQEAAANEILQGLQRKITHQTESLGPEDLVGSFVSNAEEDIEWFENLFAKAHPGGLKPSEIYQKLHESNELAARRLAQLSIVYTNYLVDYDTVVRWDYERRIPLNQVLRNVGTQEQFTKTLIEQFKSLKLDPILRTQNIDGGSFYKIALPHIASTHGHKLRIKAQATYLNKEGFFSPSTFKFDEALGVFDPKEIKKIITQPIDPKEIQKAFVEAVLGSSFMGPKTPLTDFFDQTWFRKRTLSGMLAQNPEDRLQGYDDRLADLEISPLKKGDERISGTKYENISEDTRNNLNDLARKLSTVGFASVTDAKRSVRELRKMYFERILSIFSHAEKERISKVVEAFLTSEWIRATL